MKILAFSPHPDDLEFLLGGTLIGLSKKHDITMLVMTDGSAGSHGTVEERKHEQEAAAAMLNAELEWGGKRDCTLHATPEAKLAMAQLIREHRPDMVIAPHWDQIGGPHDGMSHPDHRALGMMVRDGMRFARFNIPELDGEKHDCEHLLWYMVPPHILPTHRVDVTGHEERMKKLWKCHKTQTNLKDGKVLEFLLERRKDGDTLLEYVRSERELPEGFWDGTGLTVEGP